MFLVLVSWEISRGKKLWDYVRYKFVDFGSLEREGGLMFNRKELGRRWFFSRGVNFM